MSDQPAPALGINHLTVIPENISDTEDDTKTDTTDGPAIERG